MPRRKTTTSSPNPQDPGERCVRFFDQILRHAKGEWRGRPLTLAPWQSDRIIRPLFGTLRPDGLRRYRTSYIGFPRKNGKALAVDTPIPTPTGWIPMGQIGIGDEVFDGQGRPCRVTEATDVMLGHACYQISFSDGSVIVADADHQWYVEPRWAKPRVITTEQMIGRVKVGSRSTHQEHRYRIPVAGALDTPEAELPIAPYTLGAWLGDGHTTAARLTNADPEVWKSIAAEGYMIGLGASGTSGLTRSIGLASSGRGMSARGSLHTVLRQEGLLGRKHIPQLYFRASIPQRLALLQGLMDTDGHATPRGQCEFTTTLLALAEGILELVRSLGMKPTVRAGRAKLNGRDIGPKWRIQFFPPDGLPVFRISRKVVRQRPDTTRARRSASRFVTAIVPVQSVPVRCIQVDSSTNLFLAGEAMVPTHNSTICAGIALYLLVSDGEPGAEIYSAAADRDQAAIVFELAKQMVESSPELGRRVKIYKRSLVYEKLGASYKVLSADAHTKHGLNAHGIIFDELHAQPNRELWDVLNTSTGARRQPLRIAITTAGYDRHSICWEVYQYALRVRDGLVDDPTFLPVIYEADEKADWQDPAVWRQANPGLGESLKEEYLREEAGRAAEIPAYQNTFRRLHLNQWTEQATRWLDLAVWDRNNWDVPEEALAGQPCMGGLDLSTTTDLSALVLLFVLPDGRRVARCRFWCPEEGMRRRSERDRVPYDVWAKQGFLTPTPGNVVDYTRILADLQTLGATYQIRELAVDRWNSTQLVTQLQQDGLTVALFGQGFASMSMPTKALEGELLAGRIGHGGHPILRWMAGNVTVRQDPAGNLKPDKAKSTERIDGIVALIMALARSMLQGGAGSVYETRGLLVV